MRNGFDAIRAFDLGLACSKGLHIGTANSVKGSRELCSVGVGPFSGEVVAWYGRHSSLKQSRSTQHVCSLKPYIPTSSNCESEPEALSELGLSRVTAIETVIMEINSFFL
jgi:hypothetical protein